MKSMNLGFLLYDSRSGSTWLASQLHGYSNLHILKESTFTSRILSLKGEVSNSSFQELYAHILSDRQNLEIGFDIAKLLNEAYIEGIDSILLLSNIYKSIRELLGLSEDQVLIIKDQLFSLSDVLLVNFQEALFISLVRDGWEVFLSKRNTLAIDGLPFTRSVITSAIRWNYFAGCARRLENTEVRHVLLKYEDLKDFGRPYLEENLENIVRLGNKYCEEMASEYAMEIGDSQRGLHNNVLKLKVSSSYSFKKGEMSLYRLLTRKTANRLGYHNWDYDINSVVLLYWFIVDLGRYTTHKLKSNREFKL